MSKRPNRTDLTRPVAGGRNTTIGWIVALLSAYACSQADTLPTNIVAEVRTLRMLRDNQKVDTVLSPSVPRIPLPPTAIWASDSFRIVDGLVPTATSIFVLDPRRDPHISEVDYRSATTKRRFTRHVSFEHDTLRPVDMNLRLQDRDTTLLVLDARRKRLVEYSLRTSPDGTPLRNYDLSSVIAKDNPRSFAISSWGAALAGSMMGGTEFVYSSDLRRWELWRDTTNRRFRLPLSSFMRALANTSTIAMHPTDRMIVLASEYQHSLAIVDLANATLKRVLIDSVARAPARLRLAEDKSVRLTWDPAVKLHFLSIAVTPNVIALLDCGCNRKPNPAIDGRVIWLFRWSGTPIARLMLPIGLTHIAFSRDYRSLIGVVETGAWSRLVRWNVPDQIVNGDLGRVTPP
jgi:hypothetical protein